MGDQAEPSNHPPIFRVNLRMTFNMHHPKVTYQSSTNLPSRILYEFVTVVFASRFSSLLDLKSSKNLKHMFTQKSYFVSIKTQSIMNVSVSKIPKKQPSTNNGILEPQTTIYKWMFGETTIFYAMIWNHPIETSIYKWLFGVPGFHPHQPNLKHIFSNWSRSVPR